MMKKRSLYFPSTIALLCLLASCEKWQDKKGEDLGLNNYYCNAPEAINYNHGFPGIPNDSICIFPVEPFIGTYTYEDSIYDADNELQTIESRPFAINRDSRIRFSFDNFCANGKKLYFIADRFYRATSDSLIFPGELSQLMCRDQDTLSANLEYKTEDKSLLINFTIRTDTGTVFHKGRAYKN